MIGHYALGQHPDSIRPSFMSGADISYLEQLEKQGVLYREDGIAGDLLSILSRNGINTIRLRLWHTPENGLNDLESTVAMAKRIKLAGLKLFLDFHYSDTWADPGKQTKPAAWQGLSFDALRDSVNAYTRHVMMALQEADAMPGYVQIGNEISQGLLWDEGRVGGSFNGSMQWQQLGILLQGAIDAVHEVAGEEEIYTIIHTDRGGDVAGATWFFDNLSAQQVNFDFIGLSYYPWWHGSLDEMQNTINTVVAKYGKPVIIAETAYPWTLQWFDNTNNLVGSPEHLLPGYDELPGAQYLFLRDLISIVRDAPDGLGAGVSYWAPENISVPGVGSVWENVTLFDDQGELLPGINAFKELSNVNTEHTKENFSLSLGAFPNPFKHSTTLTFALPRPEYVSVAVYDVLGREREPYIENQWLHSGMHEIIIDGSFLATGVYFCVFESSGIRKVMPLIRR